MWSGVDSSIRRVPPLPVPRQPRRALGCAHLTTGTTVTVSNSTFSENTAVSCGGAIYTATGVPWNPTKDQPCSCPQAAHSCGGYSGFIADSSPYCWVCRERRKRQGDPI